MNVSNANRERFGHVATFYAVDLLQRARVTRQTCHTVDGIGRDGNYTASLEHALHFVQVFERIFKFKYFKYFLTYSDSTLELRKLPSTRRILSTFDILVTEDDDDDDDDKNDNESFLDFVVVVVVVSCTDRESSSSSGEVITTNDELYNFCASLMSSCVLIYTRIYTRMNMSSFLRCLVVCAHEKNAFLLNLFF